MAAASIYFDHNSTTPIDERVVEAMVRTWRECGANPASQHGPGRKARRMLEEAREGIAQLLGARTGGMDADQVIFTSGGTEANNLALLGMMAEAPTRHKEFAAEYSSIVADVLVSAIEHPSVLGPAEELRRRGFKVRVAVPTNRQGKFDEAFLGSFDSLPYLASIMLANNETGMIQPVRQIAATAHEHGMLIHTDAVQAAGKIPVSFRELGVDAMTVAPHKFHGPLGIGALVVRHGVRLAPQLFGGFQQGGLRPATENVALAVGFFEALRLAVAEFSERAERMRSLRDELEQRLGEEFPDIVIIGKQAPRLPNTSCISFPGVDRQALVMALDLAGVACSTGSACASGSSEPSPTLVAMGLEEKVIRGAIRLSLGAFTTAVEVAEGASRIIKAVKYLRSQK
jgi:cysteine desulfurase